MRTLNILVHLQLLCLNNACQYNFKGSFEIPKFGGRGVLGVRSCASRKPTHDFPILKIESTPNEYKVLLYLPPFGHNSNVHL